jgi:hypothetical protein
MARATITVEVDLDAIPGTFYDAADWVTVIERDLPPWYHPTVTLADPGPHPFSMAYRGLSHDVLDPAWDPPCRHCPQPASAHPQEA